MFTWSSFRWELWKCGPHLHHHRTSTTFLVSILHYRKTWSQLQSLFHASSLVFSNPTRYILTAGLAYSLSPPAPWFRMPLQFIFTINVIFVSPSMSMIVGPGYMFMTSGYECSLYTVCTSPSVQIRLPRSRWTVAKHMKQTRSDTHLVVYRTASWSTFKII